MVSKFRAFQGGVESHIEDLSDELRARGHVVELFSSEDLDDSGGATFQREPRGFRQKGMVARDLMWNTRARSAFTARVDAFRPTLVHFHSIYHQLSPSLLGGFAGPTVMTLHDYKLAAPCYSLLRDGDICLDCVGRRVAAPAVIHRCVGDSILGSALCATEQLVHHPRYVEKIDRFIVPSRFANAVMEASGIPASKMAVVPWGVSAEWSSEGQSDASAVRVVFAGRLHRSKGLEILLEAWAELAGAHDARLVVAGDGEMATSISELSASRADLDYVGPLDRARASDLIASADLVVMPSLVAETMGLTALEAMQSGTPVLLSNRGALAELEGPGVVIVEPTVGAISHELRRLLTHTADLQALTREVRERDLARYTTSSMVDRIESEYATVLDISR